MYVSPSAASTHGLSGRDAEECSNPKGVLLSVGQSSCRDCRCRRSFSGLVTGECCRFSLSVYEALRGGGMDRPCRPWKCYPERVGDDCRSGTAAAVGREGFLGAHLALQVGVAVREGDGSGERAKWRANMRARREAWRGWEAERGKRGGQVVRTTWRTNQRKEQDLGTGKPVGKSEVSRRYVRRRERTGSQKSLVTR
jgi:hypothetical protein